jgi:hypothetical protein
MEDLYDFLDEVQQKAKTISFIITFATIVYIIHKLLIFIKKIIKKILTFGNGNNQDVESPGIPYNNKI